MIMCYLVVTSGFTINTHYCMDKVVSVHLFETKAKVCARCGMGMHKSNGCCRDEVKVIKTSSDHQKALAVNFEWPQPHADAVFPSAFINQPFYNFSGRAPYQQHIPPLISAQDTYLQINVFRI